ncbi:MAG: hypothetical protein PW789_19650 [Edaphobacter sp.]|uniref:hypothetical protein n=1 Tax=Edaphobacter sp. TaxID=1934404 RepID=UPI0023A789FC|nr:hypothetical protein [Edaphobacter sp.]MDE1178795.1 hypothetical protein [Edaphobacter sp.]
MTSRALWTEVHGLLFGAFFLLAAWTLVLECIRYYRHQPLPEHMPTWERLYLAAASTCGWLAVVTGTFIVYPWYRAPLAAGDDIRLHPRALLLAHSQTAPLHSLGMEWKEHVALLAPLAFTAAAFLWTRYRPALRQEPALRRGVLIFAAVALIATGIAGLTGAFLNKYAPVESSFATTTEAR